MTVQKAKYDFDGFLSQDLLDFAFHENNSSEIKIIGVGGGGGNAVNHMYESGIEDVQFIVCNTDSQALLNSPVKFKIQLGRTLTGGRGAGSNPEIGRQAAIESIDEITELMGDNTDMVFIAAGMGGGTGTGAAPIIAQKIKELGILTVAIVTTPFNSEIGDRMEHAAKGVEELSKAVDALIVIENEKLNVNFAELPLSEAFQKVDEVLATAAKSIVEIIKVHGAWNVDFNDVRTVMENSNVALMGAGIAEGNERAIKAVEEAISYPLLNNNDIVGARNILINIVSGEKEILVKEHQQICEHIQKISGREAKQFIIGTARDMTLGEKVKVTIIATGFDAKSIFDFLKIENIVEDIQPEEVIEKQEEKEPEKSDVKTEKDVTKQKVIDKSETKEKTGFFQTVLNLFDDPKVEEE